MFRLSWKSCLIGAVVVATLVVSASQADAWWGGGHYRSACWGCYTPYYTASYSSCCYSDYGGWYVGYRPGPVRRLLFGRYRWYYAGGYYAGGYYSWPGCCWDTCSWDVCCADSTTAAVQPAAPTEAGQPTPTPAQKPVMEAPPAEPRGGALIRGRIRPQKPVMEAPPAEPPAAMPAEPPATLPQLEPERPAVPEAPTPPSTSAEPTPEDSGLLTIYVPYDAKVSINGLLTSSKGSRRQYVSYGLKPGFSYTYEVRAEVVRDGRAVEEVHTAILTAGERTAVAFGFNAEATGGLASR